MGHGLNAVPDMIIEKSISTTSGWNVRHSGLQSWTSLIYLNDPKLSRACWILECNRPPAQTLSFDWDYTLGASTTDAVFYVWTAVEGYSSFGSFETTGVADGVFIYTGFRPRWIMWKIRRHQ